MNLTCKSASIEMSYNLRKFRRNLTRRIHRFNRLLHGHVIEATIDEHASMANSEAADGLITGRLATAGAGCAHSVSPQEVGVVFGDLRPSLRWA